MSVKSQTSGRRTGVSTAFICSPMGLGCLLLRHPWIRRFISGRRRGARHFDAARAEVSICPGERSGAIGKLGTWMLCCALGR
jgi:hypothetical protein